MLRCMVRMTLSCRSSSEPTRMAGKSLSLQPKSSTHLSDFTKSENQTKTANAKYQGHKLSTFHHLNRKTAWKRVPGTEPRKPKYL